MYVRRNLMSTYFPGLPCDRYPGSCATSVGPADVKCNEQYCRYIYYASREAQNVGGHVPHSLPQLPRTIITTFGTQCWAAERKNNAGDNPGGDRPPPRLRNTTLAFTRSSGRGFQQSLLVLQISSVNSHPSSPRGLTGRSPSKTFRIKAGPSQRPHGLLLPRTSYTIIPRAIHRTIPPSRREGRKVDCSDIIVVRLAL